MVQEPENADLTKALSAHRKLTAMTKDHRRSDSPDDPLADSADPEEALRVVQEWLAAQPGIAGRT